MDKNRIVKTFTGRREKRSNCKRIRGQYYVVGDITKKDSGECYYVEGKHHRFNNGLIEYDHNIQSYVLIHKNHLKTGVVGIDEDNNPIMGCYSPNLPENVVLAENKNSTSDTTYCMNKDLANQLGYIERYADGIFYNKECGEKFSFFTKISNKLINKNNLPYDSLYSFGVVKKVYEKTFKPEENNENLNKLGDWLESKGITFGVEFETSDGYIAQRICYKYGVLALRDGSIQGLEYVTVPLSGRKGLYALRGISKELKKRTKFDIKCALHIHLGGLERKQENIVAIQNLGYLIQDSLYDLQPYYKRGNTGHYNNNKGKDYSKAITRDNDNYVNKHPSDPNGTSKWNIASRYVWLNIIPIIFGNKKTIEFRHHSCTFDFEKIINFLICCASIIQISNEKAKDLVDIESDFYNEIKNSDDKLALIMNMVFDNNFSNIISRNADYNNKRREVMMKLRRNEDYLGQTEHKHDRMYDGLLTDGFWD